MKKSSILIIAGICVLNLTGLAQKTQVGLTGGITFSNLSGTSGGHDTHYDGRAGFTVGMLVDAPIGKTNWSFQPGVHYMQKGSFTSKTSTTKTAIAFRYAEFHFNFIHYTKGSSTRLYFGLGPTVALNLPSKTVVITDDSRTETSIAMGSKKTDNYKGLDYGANGILGMRFKNGITFAINYTYGIRNILPDPVGDDKLHNGCAGIRLGYIFRNPPKP